MALTGLPRYGAEMMQQLSRHAQKPDNDTQFDFKIALDRLNYNVQLSKICLYLSCSFESTLEIPKSSRLEWGGKARLCEITGGATRMNCMVGSP